MAPDLVKILVESKQRVPDFLESHKPVEETVTFDDDTDDEDENAEGNGAGGDSAWGGMAMGAPDDNTASSGNWGAAASSDAPEDINYGGAAGANWD